MPLTKNSARHRLRKIANRCRAGPGPGFEGGGNAGGTAPDGRRSSDDGAIGLDISKFSINGAATDDDAPHKSGHVTQTFLVLNHQLLVWPQSTEGAQRSNTVGTDQHEIEVEGRAFGFLRQQIRRRGRGRDGLTNHWMFEIECLISLFQARRFNYARRRPFHPVSENREILFRITTAVHSRTFDLFLFVTADGNVSLLLDEIVETLQGGRLRAVRPDVQQFRHFAVLPLRQ